MTTTFDYQVSIHVAVPGGGAAKRRLITARGNVTAPEGEGVGFGKEAVAVALEHAAKRAREVAEAASG